MNFIKTFIEGVAVIEPKVYNDSRGFFYESYRKEIFSAQGLKDNFVQDNVSSSAKGVLRGLHFQARRALRQNSCACFADLSTMWPWISGPFQNPRKIFCDHAVGRESQDALYPQGFCSRILRAGGGDGVHVQGFGILLTRTRTGHPLVRSRAHHSLAQARPTIHSFG